VSSTAQGAQDVPYSQQRVDEIAVQITNLLAEFTLATNELRDIESTTNSANTDSIVDGTVPIRANVDGVVWAVSPSNGNHIRKGTSLVTLIDCSRLYLDATISPRYQDKIEPGANVRLRFAGTSREFPGKVDYVRGGGVREDGLAVAQLTLDNRRNDSHAIIHVEEQAIGALPGNFCQVGRSAKVIFDGPDFHESMQQTASVTEGMTAWVRSLLKR
jgi:multidrug resistance efflux pump